MLEVLPQESLLFFSTRRRRPGERRSRENYGLQGPLKPPALSRRAILAGLGASLAVIAAGVVLETDRQHFIREEEMYQGWKEYNNRSLPSELVVRVGRQIKNSPFPGFAPVGEFMVRSQLEYSLLEQFYPPLQQPIEVKMSDLVQTDQALADFTVGSYGVSTEVWLTDKVSSRRYRKVLLDPQSYSATVGLENQLYLGSSMAKATLLVKEFSHLLYLDQLKSLIYGPVAARFDISTAARAPVDSLFLLNALLFGKPNQPSGFGSHYDNSLMELDYAGYWHIMPAFGAGKDSGLYTSEDLRAMDSDTGAFMLARRQGYLLPDTAGSYAFREGIGPFSEQWISLMKQVL